MMRRPQKRAAVLAALMSGAAGVASCNWIVGVGDYVIVDGAAPDITTETPDVGGGPDVVGADQTMLRDALVDVRMADGPVDGQSEADGGPSGPDVGTDTRGDAPSVQGMEGGADSADADAARLADADADADAGPAPQVDCGQGIPTGPALTGLVNACAATANCDPYLIPVNISDCITYDILNSTGDAGQWSCLAKISDCSGYFACQGVRYAATECATAPPSFCMGNSAVDCSGSTDSGVAAPGTVTNCAMTGGTCQAYIDGLGDSRAGCIISTGCTVTGASQCSGNNVFTCVRIADGGTVADARNCGAGSCVGGGCTFGTQCMGATLATLSCNGSTLDCVSAGVPSTYDCARAGGTCAPNGGNAVCVSPGCSTSSTCVETCGGTGAGATITACVGGATYPLACGQYGFNFCKATSTTPPFAYCIP